MRLCRNALARGPDRPAVEFDGKWFDWGRLARTAHGLWEALAATGAPGEAPVVFIPRNHPASLAALLGLLAQGRTVRMVYAFQSPEAVARELDALDACAVVAERRDLAGAVEAALVRKGIAGVGLDGMEVATVVPAGPIRRGTIPDRPSVEILTSGTTGPPKRFAVPYTLLEQHFLATPLTAAQGEDPESQPPLLMSYPLGNITGLYITLPALLRGQKIILLERFRLSAWRDYVKRHRPSHSGLPPSCVRELLDARVPRDDLASLAALGVGAAPLDPGVQAAFEDAYGIPILVSYGATEFAGPVTAVSPEDHARFGRAKLGTVGTALPGVRLRVVDPASGAELAAGDEGVLEVVSPRIGPEWIRTTDLARIDGDGFLFILGRIDGAINRGGFKVLPESVERALMKHPDVAEAAVTGVADRRLGEVPVAAVRVVPGRPEPSPSELEGFVRNELPAPSVPTKWLFCEDFPRTSSHKTDRVALRRLFAESS